MTPAQMAEISNWCIVLAWPAIIFAVMIGLIVLFKK